MKNKGIVVILGWEQLMELPIILEPKTFREALESWALHVAVGKNMIKPDEMERHHVAFVFGSDVTITLWENDDVE